MSKFGAHVVAATNMFCAIRNINRDDLTDPIRISNQHLSYLDKMITVFKVQSLDDLKNYFEGYVLDTNLQKVYYYETPSPSMSP